MDKKEEKKTNLEAPLVYQYKDKNLAKVSKSPEQKFKIKLKEDEKILKDLYEKNVNIIYENRTKGQEPNQTNSIVEKICFTTENSKNLIIETPIIKKRNEITFNVKDGEVWRNF